MLRFEQRAVARAARRQDGYTERDACSLSDAGRAYSSRGGIAKDHGKTAEPRQ
jgi:hypothetical protein